MGGARLPATEQNDRRALLYEALALPPLNTKQKPALHVLCPVLLVDGLHVQEWVDPAM